MLEPMFNRMRKFLSALVVLICFLTISWTAYSQSLSDMQWEGFQKKHGKTSVKVQSDPFASSGTAVEDLSIEELQLSGIVYYNENDAYALISGYLVRPGDRIAGYRVDIIEREKVKLRRVDEVYVLVLGGGI